MSFETSLRSTEARRHRGTERRGKRMNGMKKRLMIAAGIVSAVCGVALGAKKGVGPATLPVVSSNAVAAAAAAAAVLSAEQAQFFEAKVRPVLAANCYKCHSAEAGKAKGGLTLDTREGVLKG